MDEWNQTLVAVIIGIETSGWDKWQKTIQILSKVAKWLKVGCAEKCCACDS